VPVQITQKGADHVDLVLAAQTYSRFNPTIKTESGANVVRALNIVDTPSPGVVLPEMPIPLTDSAKQTIARSLDDMRELEAMDLYVEDGIGEVEVEGARTPETVP